MAILMITYNLNGGDEDYKELFETIRGFGDTWHKAAALDSVWFLKTLATPEQVSRAIGRVLTEQDNWFVVDITHRRRQGWLSKGLWEWLST